MLIRGSVGDKLTWQRPTLRLLSIEMLPKLSEHGTNFKQSIWLMIVLSAALHWYRTQPGDGYANADVFDDSRMVMENSLLCFSLCCLTTTFLALSNSIATILPLDTPHQTSKHLHNGGQCNGVILFFIWKRGFAEALPRISSDGCHAA